MLGGRALALGLALTCAAPAARANVHLVRRADGSAMIFNDVGSGWRVNGRAPSDEYLVARRDATTPYDDLIRHHAGREGVDHRLVRSVVLVESNFNPRAVSRKGARGLMQLMPATAAQYGVRNAFDAAENIRAGVKYLAELLSTFAGDVTLALAAYNAGPGAVTRHGGVPPYPETQEYIRRTMVAWGGVLPRALGGGFRGVGTTAPPPAAVAARRGPPVKMGRSGDGVLISNQPGAPSRGPVPVLGRAVPPGVSSAGR
ncbi:lytic transglycosylase domain-containing protein [Acidobacteria bacterium ACD]|nr:MAG: lytic transglycosylase domain-containing protein [Acidobacteriota bacterium]MDL1949813.1 lytic transglycosylase domain-containing protein [Acidobacteria bacterium ACD]